MFQPRKCISKYRLRNGGHLSRGRWVKWHKWKSVYFQRLICLTKCSYHLGLVRRICDSELVNIGSGNVLTPIHYLNQCWIIVNGTIRNKRKWNLNQNIKLHSIIVFLQIMSINVVAYNRAVAQDRCSLNLTINSRRPNCPGQEEIALWHQDFQSRVVRKATWKGPNFLTFSMNLGFICDEGCLYLKEGNIHSVLICDEGCLHLKEAAWIQCSYVIEGCLHLKEGTIIQCSYVMECCLRLKEGNINSVLIYGEDCLHLKGGGLNSVLICDEGCLHLKEATQIQCSYVMGLPSFKGGKHLCSAHQCWRLPSFKWGKHKSSAHIWWRLPSF